MTESIDIIDEHKYDCFFADDNAARLVVVTDNALQVYTALGNLADRECDLLWNAVPKLHWWWHLAARAKFLNPRRGANFIDEDFHRLIKILGRSCLHGTPRHAVPRKMMRKYRHGVDIEELCG